MGGSEHLRCLKAWLFNSNSSFIAEFLFAAADHESFGLHLLYHYVVSDGGDDKRVSERGTVLLHQFLSKFDKNGGIFLLFPSLGQQVLLDAVGKETHQVDQMGLLCQPVGHHKYLHTGSIAGATHEYSVGSEFAFCTATYSTSLMFRLSRSLQEAIRAL